MTPTSRGGGERITGCDCNFSKIIKKNFVTLNKLCNFALTEFPKPSSFENAQIGESFKVFSVNYRER